MKNLKALKKLLDELHKKYNHRKFVHPDPLEFLYYYDDPLDREIVGLIAASLAYGNVWQILKSVASVLERLGPLPRAFILERSDKQFKKNFADFKHRFTTGDDVVNLLVGAKRAIKKRGSLHNSFLSYFSDEDENVLPALCGFVDEITSGFSFTHTGFISSPDAKSACKRLNLFLRWMVRRDEVDPGGWNDIPRSKLVVPLDTHMHKIAIMLGLTRRKQADIKTALEITDAFKKIEPDDPVKYDFVLTRFGIRNDERFRFESLCARFCTFL